MVTEGVLQPVLEVAAAVDVSAAAEGRRHRLVPRLDEVVARVLVAAGLAAAAVARGGHVADGVAVAGHKYDELNRI